MTVNVTDNQAADNDTSSSEPSWWIDENTPGVGDRPDWLPEKFKSAADISKSYSELEKRLGSEPKAPEQYDLSKGEWMDPDNTSIKEFIDFAKSKNVPQDVMDKMAESVGSYINSFDVNLDDVKAELGSDADERLERLDNWAKSNFTEETYNQLTNGMVTAAQIKAVEEMREKMNDSNTMIPTDKDSSDGKLSIEDIQAEMTNNIDKYKTDPVYRREIQRKIEAASKDSQFVDKTY